MYSWLRYDGHLPVEPRAFVRVRVGRWWAHKRWLMESTQTTRTGTNRTVTSSSSFLSLDSVAVGFPLVSNRLPVFFFSFTFFFFFLVGANESAPSSRDLKSRVQWAERVGRWLADSGDRPTQSFHFYSTASSFLLLFFYSWYLISQIIWRGETEMATLIQQVTSSNLLQHFSSIVFKWFQTKRIATLFFDEYPTCWLGVPKTPEMRNVRKWEMFPQKRKKPKELFGLFFIAWCKKGEGYSRGLVGTS